MNNEIVQKCELLAQNQKAYYSLFKYKDTGLRISCSLLMAQEGRQVEKEELKECCQIIEKSIGTPKYFKDLGEMPAITKMILSHRPSEYFATIRQLGIQFDNKKFFYNDQAIIAAIIIADQVEAEARDKYVAKTKNIFQRMKSDHSLLTTEYDLVLAALLAVSDIDLNNVFLDMEECFELLKQYDDYTISNHPLSHILALNMAAPNEKVAKTLRIQRLLEKRLNKNRIHYTDSFERVFLGLLASLDMTSEEIAGLVKETYDYMKAQKGFYASMDAITRTTYASAMVLMTYGYNTDIINAEYILLCNALYHAVIASK